MNGFTIYEEYYDLMTLLPEIEQQELLLAITKYMFKDIEPVLNENQMKIFKNLKRPLDISKNQSKRRTGRKPEENQKKTGEKPEKNPRETHQDVNVYVNGNVDVNNLEEKGYGEGKPLVIDDTSLLAEFTKQVIEYLNSKTNSHFKHSVKATKQKINARLNEGYTLDDFIVVIDKKTKEWLGTDFEKYLRPETLFGSKFEGYLNQKMAEKKSSNPFLDYAKEKGYL